MIHEEIRLGTVKNTRFIKLFHEDLSLGAIQKESILTLLYPASKYDKINVSSLSNALKERKRWETVDECFCVFSYTLSFLNNVKPRFITHLYMNNVFQKFCKKKTFIDKKN